MKTLLKSAVLLLGMGLLSTHSQAQKVVVEDKEPNSVMFVTIDKAGNEIIRIMNASQSPRFHEPKAPRFLLTDRKGKFALGIGGYVKLAAEYDFGGISDNIDFYPALIPRQRTVVCTEPVSDGRHYEHDLPEAGRTYGPPGRFRGVYGW